MRMQYSKKMINWLKDNSSGIPGHIITRRFNARFKLDKSTKQIRGALKNRGFLIGPIKKKYLDKYPNQGLMNKGQRLWLIEKYQYLPLPELASFFNHHYATDIKPNQFRYFLKNHGITCQRDGKYRKGNIPLNKGIKCPTGIVPPGGFNKNHIPHNHVPVGTKKIRMTGKYGYWWVKIGSEGNWKQLHILNWEEANGRPLPKNHVLRFIDGNSLNYKAENLELITRGLLARFNYNQLNHQPPHLKQTVELISRLQDKTAQFEKEIT